jgi:steroid 5-alpha reductase family enzyme
MSFVIWMLIFSIAINLFMFFPAFIFKTDKLTDISYAITFILVAFVGYVFSQKSATQLFLSIIVVVWALRLGAFLFIRINKMKRDIRFDGIRDKFFIFLRFWLLQGITVFIVLVPCILFWDQTATQINWLSGFGIIIFAAGLLIESVADIQKNRFRNSQIKTWIDVGLWRTSRHPNYLGEIMLWIGVYIFVIPSLTPTNALIALVGPLYIAVLIIFVSGIPLLEKAADKKWGSEKGYQQYKSKVPVLLPSFRSVRRII